MDLEQIAQLRVVGSTEGMDKVKSDLDGVAASQQNVANQSQAAATVTETSARRTLDASVQYTRAAQFSGCCGRRYGGHLKKRQSVINAALDQGHISQAQAASDIALLAERYSKSDQARTLFTTGQAALDAKLASGTLSSKAYRTEVEALASRLGQTSPFIEEAAEQTRTSRRRRWLYPTLPGA